MGDDRNRILDLLAAGKITAEEAARLLDALEANPAQAAGAETSAGTGAKTGWPKFFSSGAKATERTGATGTAKFMYVKVVSGQGDNVNVKIPLALLRAGLKLTSLIPAQAQDQINKTMAEKGMAFDLNNFKPEDLEELIDALREMEVDVDAANGDKVHVYAA
ncbi:MAG: hypothetical protein A2133_00730 [Actinobacteria bacterium RBG_16_64_13]|nr:MAG: hypothetical protein A2133_00730 [Actinobacteria bacterium RBG_16_64_13]